MINGNGYAVFEDVEPKSSNTFKVVLVVVLAIALVTALVLWAAGVFDQDDPVRSQEDKFISSIVVDEDAMSPHDRAVYLEWAETYCAIMEHETVSEAQQYLILIGMDEGQAQVFGTAARQYICVTDL
ncbi:membrane protein [Gordonia phage Guey18]|nr:membrane protein [Gordonia phage Guey18]